MPSAVTARPPRNGPIRRQRSPSKRLAGGWAKAAAAMQRAVEDRNFQRIGSVVLKNIIAVSENRAATGRERKEETGEARTLVVALPCGRGSEWAVGMGRRKGPSKRLWAVSECASLRADWRSAGQGGLTTRRRMASCPTFQTDKL